MSQFRYPPGMRIVLVLLLVAVWNPAMGGKCPSIVALPEGEVVNNGQMRIIRRHHPTPEDFALLDRTIWGTNGALYTQPDSASFLAASSPLELYILERLDRPEEPLGVYALYPKKLGMGDGGAEDQMAYYRSSLAVRADCQGGGLGKWLTETAYGCMMDSLKQPAGFCYGYIEAENAKSMKLAEHNGSVNLGTFETLFFSRWFPTRHPQIVRATWSERDEILSRLKAQYRDYALTDFDYSLNVNEYAVWKDSDGKILAGLQYDPYRWEGKRIPGAKGWAMLHLPPLIPILSTSANFKDFRFLKFGNFLYPPEHRPLIEKMMESLLAQHDLHHGVIFAGNRDSQLYRDLTSFSLGYTNKDLQTPVNVMARFTNDNDPRIKIIQQKPILPSIADH